MLSIRDETFLEPDALSLEVPAMAVCYGDAIQGRLAFDEGSSQRLPKRSTFPEAPFVESRVPLGARSGRMRVIAAIVKADMIAAILKSLGLDTEPPTIRPARAPPEYELVEIDWT